MRQLLPRFLIVVVMVPALFAGAAFTAVALGRPPEGAAAIVGAVSFAAIALAPSTRNALLRVLVTGVVVGLAWVLASVTR